MPLRAAGPEEVYVSSPRAANPLHVLFHPASVAVIGASTSPHKVGNRICRQLLAEGYAGRVIPVNARGEEVAGRPSVRRLTDAADPVDVAVITTATDAVLEAVTDCAKHGVKVAIIHTAGFGEVGPDGLAKEREIVSIARSAGMRVVGPNCMQVYSAGSRLNLIGTPFPAGSVAMVSQSGNLIRAVTEDFETVGLGFSKFVSVGNQADLAIDEYLDYLKDDSDTSVILLYVEGFLPGTGPRFVEIARRTVRTKPVVLLKGGTSRSGSRAAVSHTGSLAGERRVVEAAMRQAGVLIAERLDELVPMAEALARLPLPRGRRVAVIGGGGGHATICADAVENNGMEAPELSAGAQARIRPLLPDRAASVNPVDFTGASEREIAVYAKVPEIALDDGMSAALLYGLYAGYRTDLERPGNTYVDTSHMIVDLVRRSGKPIVMQTVYSRRPFPSLKVLRDGGVPVTDSAEQAARMLRALCEYADVRARPEEPPAPPAGLATLSAEALRLARSRPARNLTEPESLALLARHGIAVVPHRVVEGGAAAVAAARELGHPVVLKALAESLVHKSDAGGVALDLRNDRAVRGAWRRVSSATGAARAVVASYRPGGLELIVGAFRDPTFGPTLLLGLGGIFVEALDDVALQVLPCSRREADALLERLRARALLGPLRDRPPRDRGALVDTLLGVANLVLRNPDVTQVDLNPVLSFERGAVVADARVIVGA